jgi:hypothetical protein
MGSNGVCLFINSQGYCTGFSSNEQLAGLVISLALAIIYLLILALLAEHTVRINVSHRGRKKRTIGIREL